jgi:hypothetical protein
MGPLPIVPEQRDFSPWNVLIDSDGGLGVLDWESAELDGLPALDLIYFLTYLAFQIDGVAFGSASPRLCESYRRTLDPSSFTGAIRTECLDRYALRVGLRRETLGPLAVLTWLIHSRSDYQHVVTDFAGRPHPAALRGSVFLSLLEEEIRQATQTAPGNLDEVRSVRLPLAAN